MKAFTFRPAVRGHIPLIIGISGPTKSGKTLSSLRLATGLAGGKPIAMLNTEGPRGHQYCEKYPYLAAELSAPFRYTSFIEALEEMKTMDIGCAIIDSVSAGHDGPGGFLEWHEEILNTIAGKDYAKRERSTFVAWVQPKASERQFIYAIQALKCPVILAMRGKEKIKISKGKVEELGWQPIVGEPIAFETIFTLMLPPHSKGVPDLSISDMREPFDSMITPDKQIDEALGRELAEWAKGSLLVPLGATTQHAMQQQTDTVKIADNPPESPRSRSHQSVVQDKQSLLEQLQPWKENRGALEQAFGTRIWAKVERMPMDELLAGLVKLQGNQNPTAETPPGETIATTAVSEEGVAVKVSPESQAEPSETKYASTSQVAGIKLLAQQTSARASAYVDGLLQSAGGKLLLADYLEMEYSLRQQKAEASQDTQTDLI